MSETHAVKIFVRGTAENDAEKGLENDKFLKN